jgi:hypothetical protein
VNLPLQVVPFELHSSVTSEARSIAKKITLALFVNTLVVTLLVNAYIPSDNKVWGNKDGAKDFDYKVYDLYACATSMWQLIGVCDVCAWLMHTSRGCVCSCNKALGVCVCVCVLMFDHV